MSEHNRTLSMLCIRVQDAKWDLSPELTKAFKFLPLRTNTGIHRAQLSSYSPESAFFQWLFLVHYQASSEGGMHTWVTTNCFEERKEKCPSLNTGHYRLLEHTKISTIPVPPAVRWSVAHSMLLNCPRGHRCCPRIQSLKETVQQLHCTTHPTQGKKIARTQLKKVTV